MKKLLILLFAATCCLLVMGQDLLYIKHRRVIQAKIIEINKGTIIYRLHANPEHGKYVTSKRFVDSIVYASGIVEKFIAAKYVRPKRFSRYSEADNLTANQLSAGFLTFGNDAKDYNQINAATNIKNPGVAALFLKYETELLRNRLGISISPFLAFNKKAYGGAIGAKFNIKRLGKFRIGIGPEYLLSVQDDFVERYSYSTDNGNFSFSRKYNTTLSILSGIVSMNLHINPKVCITSDIGVGGVIASSKRNEGLPANWSYVRAGTVGNFKLGLGYRF